MTTTISPTLGHGPWTQQGVGTSPGYDAIDIRRLAAYGLQQGVLSSTSYEVTQRGAGANMSVDIAANLGIGATVLGDAVAAQGHYHIAPHSASINETIATADGTNPRVDRVVLEVKDHQHDASGSNLAQTRVITGTPTSGATLDNLSGAAAVPDSALLLADVHVPASDTTISNSQIRDRRSWSFGAYYTIRRTGGNYSTTSATHARMDTTNLNPRIECYGTPMRVTLQFNWQANTDKEGSWELWQDGSVVTGGRRKDVNAVGGSPQPAHLVWEFTPSAGSHLFAPAHASPDGATTVITLAGATTALTFTIEELVRLNTPNNATTTG